MDPLIAGQLFDTFNDLFAAAVAVRYLRDQWLPRGPQFLEYFVKNYRNYGMRSSQGSEAQHFSCKVFFDNNLADLHILLSRLQEMVKQKGIVWKQEYSREAAIRRHDHRNCPIRRELATKITYRALNLLRDQFIMASSARLGTHDLGDCTGVTTRATSVVEGRKEGIIGRSITAQVGRGRCDQRSWLRIAIFSRCLRSLPSQLWVIAPSLFIDEWKEPPG